MAEKKTRGVRKTFTALLEPDGTELKWVIVRVPFDPAKAWPVRNGRRVRGEIEEFAFRTSLFPDPRSGGHLVLVNKKMQRGAHARVGDRVHIWLEPDLEERPVEIPPELARELNADRELRKWFDGMSKSTQRWMGQWTGEPKSPESRRRRAEKIVERLMQTMEGEMDPPPVLRAAFARIPAAREGWFALTPIQRRNHLLGIFYYETAAARERRAAQAIEDALKAAKRKRTARKDEA
jgi:uncharacterized protein YdeI (YjbR/CyaY-like superfamily)